MIREPWAVIDTCVECGKPADYQHLCRPCQVDLGYADPEEDQDA